MRDLIGNHISEGSLIWWLSKAIPMRIVRVTDAQLVVGQGKVPARMILEVTVPIQEIKGGDEPQFTDFLAIVNPDHESVIEGMLEGQQTQ
jgi:hypothetical protein